MKKAVSSHKEDRRHSDIENTRDVLDNVEALLTSNDLNKNDRACDGASVGERQGQYGRRNIVDSANVACLPSAPCIQSSDFDESLRRSLGKVASDRAAAMRVDTFEDEFEKYFARAALRPDTNELSKEEERRRAGSLPDATLKTPDLLTISPSGVRRASSCKYPSRRRRERSPSPRHASRGASTSPSRSGTALRPTNISGSSSCRRSLTSTSPRRTSVISPEVNIVNPTEPYPINNTMVSPEVSSQTANTFGDTLHAPGLSVKCHSAPHSRSSSWKKGKRPRGRQSDPTPEQRENRTGSVSLEDTLSKLERLRLLQADDYCPVRNFSRTSKGLINRGDSFKRKSFTSVASECGSGSTDERRSRINSATSSSGAGPETSSFKVLVIGDHGVGKTALIQQFMTSEYMGAVDASFDDEGGEVTVSVLLDGEETTMDFIDIPFEEMNKDRVDEVDAFVIIFSLTERSTFLRAQELLTTIRKLDNKNMAAIMVANKSEVIRSRQVAVDEGKEICMKYDCKYIEVSAVLNHRIDELLVGIVTQIRLNPTRLKHYRKRSVTEDGSRCSPKGAKVILDRIFRRQSFAARSCDNLLVL